MSAEAAIAALTRGAEPRTWSLIVTIFGDLARGPGAAIEGPVLSLITGRIGVRPEAMRVALHRLRKDNWLRSERVGRGARYKLTAHGRAEVARASARIYAAAPAAPERWQVLVAGPVEAGQRLALDGRLAAEGCLGLGPGAWLCPRKLRARPAGLFALDGAAPEVPAWLAASLMPDDLLAHYADFARALAEAEAALAAGLGALDRAALRVLVVHGWRRLLLRHADLPDGFFPDGWKGPEARARVQRLLAALGTPTMAEIAEAAEA